jgi:hypothetical protein
MFHSWGEISAYKVLARKLEERPRHSDRIILKCILEK